MKQFLNELALHHTDQHPLWLEYYHRTKMELELTEFWEDGIIKDALIHQCCNAGISTDVTAHSNPASTKAHHIYMERFFQRQLLAKQPVFIAA